MWTLSEVQTRLGNRLAEDSVVFWSLAERTAAINDAQRFIASVTDGVPSIISGTVNSTVPYLTSPTKLLSSYEISGWVGGDSATALRPISHSYANMADPGWVNRRGTPRWVMVHPAESRIYFAPTPLTSISVSARVAVLPDDLVDAADVLFNGEPLMEKYQGALLNFAASMLLLKERYDGDAERFYQFAIQELQMLGIDPVKIPPPAPSPTPGGE